MLRGTRCRAREGLVHRDVKPANILITVEDGAEHAYLTDFGVAKRSDSAAALTAQGAVVGTVDYMSPEQITGGHADARTDVYALGCVFFQMLTGTVPYERENSIAKLFAHVHEPPPQPAGAIAEEYPAFGPVLEQAMAKDPADRYLSAGDFARDAGAALQGTRYTGPATTVGVGDAKPSDDPSPPGSAPPPETPDEVAAGSEVIPPPETPDEVAAGSEVIPPRHVSAASEVIPPTHVSAAVPRAGTEPPHPADAPLTERPPPTAEPPATESQPTIAPEPARARTDRRRYGWAALVALVVVGGIVGVVIALGGGGSTGGGPQYAAAAEPVPTNRVTGSGSASLSLKGDHATVTLDTNGLLNGDPHAMHIHAGGKGVCPPASAARDHNGHLSISTTNGIKFYGPPQVSLTTHGDTSTHSIVDFARYPTVGDIRYTRTVPVPPGVVAAIRSGNAVIVVHGIDYNGNMSMTTCSTRARSRARCRARRPRRRCAGRCARTQPPRRRQGRAYRPTRPRCTSTTRRRCRRRRRRRPTVTRASGFSATSTASPFPTQPRLGRRARPDLYKLGVTPRVSQFRGRRRPRLAGLP
jgi:hypothetical protein